MQPRLAPYIRIALDALDLSASLYQPTSLFVKNGRKLPNAPEPGDPWHCYLRRNGEFGIVSSQVGATADDAVSAALYARPGLQPAIVRLGRALDELTEVLHARQG